MKDCCNQGLTVVEFSATEWHATCKICGLRYRASTKFMLDYITTGKLGQIKGPIKRNCQDWQLRFINLYFMNGEDVYLNYICPDCGMPPLEITPLGFRCSECREVFVFPRLKKALKAWKEHQLSKETGNIQLDLFENANG
ncbi:hypothetical protein [uncultured Victivallis sp.]|uniref:hypothetical protein n=1 Tax=uncultured Victivallis sp. TaxID=354118 RepID=UPI0025987F45|nr:hypothetical protein [uncultured Victivallis sp.]